MPKLTDKGKAKLTAFAQGCRALLTPENGFDANPQFESLYDKLGIHFSGVESFLKSRNKNVANISLQDFQSIIVQNPSFKFLSEKDDLIKQLHQAYQTDKKRSYAQRQIQAAIHIANELKDNLAHYGPTNTVALTNLQKHFSVLDGYSATWIPALSETNKEASVKLAGFFRDLLKELNLQEDVEFSMLERGALSVAKYNLPKVIDDLRNGIQASIDLYEFHKKGTQIAQQKSQITRELEQAVVAPLKNIHRDANFSIQTYENNINTALTTLDQQLKTMPSKGLASITEINDFKVNDRLQYIHLDRGSIDTIDEALVEEAQFPHLYIFRNHQSTTIYDYYKNKWDEKSYGQVKDAINTAYSKFAQIATHYRDDPKKKELLSNLDNELKVLCATMTNPGDVQLVCNDYYYQIINGPLRDRSPNDLSLEDKSNLAHYISFLPKIFTEPEKQRLLNSPYPLINILKEINDKLSLQANVFSIFKAIQGTINNHTIYCNTNNKMPGTTGKILEELRTAVMDQLVRHINYTNDPYLFKLLSDQRNRVRQISKILPEFKNKVIEKATAAAKASLRLVELARNPTAANETILDSMRQLNETSTELDQYLDSVQLGFNSISLDYAVIFESVYDQISFNDKPILAGITDRADLNDFFFKLIDDKKLQMLTAVCFSSARAFNDPNISSLDLIKINDQMREAESDIISYLKLRYRNFVEGKKIFIAEFIAAYNKGKTEQDPSLPAIKDISDVTTFVQTQLDKSLSQKKFTRQLAQAETALQAVEEKLSRGFKVIDVDFGSTTPEPSSSSVEQLAQLTNIRENLANRSKQIAAFIEKSKPVVEGSNQLVTNKELNELAKQHGLGAIDKLQEKFKSTASYLNKAQQLQAGVLERSRSINEKIHDLEAKINYERTINSTSPKGLSKTKTELLAKLEKQTEDLGKIQSELSENKENINLLSRQASVLTSHLEKKTTELNKLEPYTDYAKKKEQQSQELLGRITLLDSGMGTARKEGDLTKGDYTQEMVRLEKRLAEFEEDINQDNRNLKILNRAQKKLNLATNDYLIEYQQPNKDKNLFDDTINILATDLSGAERDNFIKKSRENRELQQTYVSSSLRKASSYVFSLASSSTTPNVLLTHKQSLNRAATAKIRELQQSITARRERLPSLHALLQSVKEKHDEYSSLSKRIDTNEQTKQERVRLTAESEGLKQQLTSVSEQLIPARTKNIELEGALNKIQADVRDQQSKLTQIDEKLSQATTHYKEQLSKVTSSIARITHTKDYSSDRLNQIQIATQAAADYVAKISSPPARDFVTVLKKYNDSVQEDKRVLVKPYHNRKDLIAELERQEKSLADIDELTTSVKSLIDVAPESDSHTLQAMLSTLQELSTQKSNIITTRRNLNEQENLLRDTMATTDQELHRSVYTLVKATNHVSSALESIKQQLKECNSLTPDKANEVLTRLSSQLGRTNVEGLNAQTDINYLMTINDPHPSLKQLPSMSEKINKGLNSIPELVAEIQRSKQNQTARNTINNFKNTYVAALQEDLKQLERTNTGGFFSFFSSNNSNIAKQKAIVMELINHLKQFNATHDPRYLNNFIITNIKTVRIAYDQANNVILPAEIRNRNFTNIPVDQLELKMLKLLDEVNRLNKAQAPGIQPNK